MNEIVTVAERLLPLIREHRHATEKDRRIAEPIVKAIRQSGLCRMLLDTGSSPRHTPDEWLRVLAVLAGAEASVSWFVWNNTLPCFWSRFLSDAARKRVFGDARHLFTGSTRPTGTAVLAPGGYRLSGRWSLVSGCELADFIYLACRVYENGSPRMLAPDQPERRMLFVPKGRFEIIDTWHAGGLRGSGSHDVVVDDLFVTAEDSFIPTPPTASRSPLAQLPIVAVMVAGLGAQFLGMARTAIEVTIEILRTKVSVDPGSPSRDRPGTLADIAWHSAAVAAAERHLHASVAALWEKAGQELASAEDRAAVYSAGLYAVAAGRSAVVAMQAAAGTPALYIDCPLERSVRDLQAMDKHVTAQPIWLEDSGRVLMGQEPTSPFFMT
jgi:alkylation response protein AidB-like acyl-CoA dehydrogenase